MSRSMSLITSNSNLSQLVCGPTTASVRLDWTGRDWFRAFIWSFLVNFGNVLINGIRQMYMACTVQQINHSQYTITSLMKRLNRLSVAVSPHPSLSTSMLCGPEQEGFDTLGACPGKHKQN